ncbi:hypothetical protein G7Y89_g13195 [Cudoniella acicularis]|uniref:Heterokaryon incompatibility domain-containing protein n=1 Tax=Cudoniella acicularis TaxID=354080 RepID=A0A8H4VYY0_9HELO|nr:hypothetical protein G7Y89_g13195 [Cudoniella acicularis]
MDIIPEPLDALPILRVPLAEPILPYDQDDFRSFPQRHGFAEDEWKLLPVDSLAALLQSWLFFGLLAECLKENFNLEDFVVRANVTTVPLNTASLSLQSLDREKAVIIYHREDVDRIRQLCQFAWRTVADLEARGSLAGSPAGETGLAIFVLTTAVELRLREARYFVKLRMVLCIFPVSRHPLKKWERLPWDSAFLRRYLQSTGWCPQQVSKVVMEQDPITAYYLSRMRFVNPYGFTHSTCTEAACTANNVQLNSRYHIRHTTENCQCQFVYANAHDVKEIIRGGGVPLISVHRRQHGQIELRVSKATARSRYTAISHVWSDGLGNPTDNALPHCQIQRLAERVWGLPQKTPELAEYESGVLAHVTGELTGEFSENVLFWMDTLCIPVSKDGDAPDVVQDVNHLKHEAIDKMAFIYAGASATLVLDSELHQRGVDLDRSGSDVDLLGKILCSTWMRRCWTLQEGALTKKAFFQCRNGVVSPAIPVTELQHHDLLDHEDIKRIGGPWIFVYSLWKLYFFFLAQTHRDLRNHTDPIRSHVQTQLQISARRPLELLSRIDGSDEHQDIRFARKFGLVMPKGQREKLCMVWNALSVRSTTKAEDLPAIFSNLLDFNTYQIFSLPPQQRLKSILTNLDKLPLDILFNPGPRIDAGRKHRDRWIPTVSSGLRMLHEDSRSDFESRTLDWTDDGNIIFSHLAPKNSYVFCVLDLDVVEKHTKFLLQLSGSDKWPDWTGLVELDRVEGDEMLENTDEFVKVALLLDTQDLAKQSWGMPGCSVFLKRRNVLRRECQVTADPRYLMAEASLQQSGNNIELQAMSKSRAGSRNTMQEELEISQRMAGAEDEAVTMEDTEMWDHPQYLDDKYIPSVYQNVLGYYDCSVRWRVPTPDDSEEHPLITGKVVEKPWALTIECDTADWRMKYPQRPHYEDLSHTIYEAVLRLDLFGVCLAISIIIRVVIEVRIGWSNLSTLGKAATIIFAIDATVLLQFLTPPPLAQTLFIVDRMRSDGGLSRLEVAYVVLSLLGSWWTISVFRGVIAWVLDRLAYRMWVQSFDKDWGVNPTGLWRRYFKFVGWIREEEGWRTSNQYTRY